MEVTYEVYRVRATTANKMFKQWRVKFKFLVLSFKQRLVVADSVVFQIPPLLKHKRCKQGTRSFETGS